MKKFLSVKNFVFLTSIVQILALPQAALAVATERDVSISGPLGNIGPNEIIQFIIYAAFALAILAALIYLIWGGINWILSGGEKEKVDEARKRIIAAVVGLILVALAVAILNFVLTLLGFCGLFNFRIPTINDPTFNADKC